MAWRALNELPWSIRMPVATRTDTDRRKMTPRGGPSWIGWASGGLFVGVVAVLTLAPRVHELPRAWFSASAARVAAGEIWLLPSSALVVDRPVVVGLVAFACLAFAALWICGTRLFWVAAVVGHIGSTLVVYAIIGSARVVDPDLFTSALTRQDFGVSAIQGSWVGAITATAWRSARADARARVLVAAGVCALAAVAWTLHPDPSILTTEHFVAFLIGCSAIAWPQLVGFVRDWSTISAPHPAENTNTTN